MHRRLLPMMMSARLFLCIGCNQQVIICSACDRNNIYCGITCSSLARARSCYLARRRYEQTRIARLKHADRQRRYRDRLKNKVTDHSSTTNPRRALLLSPPNKRLLETLNAQYCCHCCNTACSPFLRRGFLRHYSPLWPLAP